MIKAGWKIFWLAALVFACALVAARLVVPDVVPVSFDSEPQPSWAVLTAFGLRAIELTAAWVAVLAFAVLLGASARRWLRLPNGPSRP